MSPFQLRHRMPLMRQAFRRRTPTAKDCDALVEERNRIMRNRDELAQALAVRGINLEKEKLQLPVVTFVRSSQPQMVDDAALVTRIIRTYRASNATMGEASGSFWESAFFDLKRGVHDALMYKDVEKSQDILRNPGNNDLFYGFDPLCSSLLPLPMDPDVTAAGASESLVLLCEAHGALPLRNPEAAARPRPSLDLMLASLDAAMGVPIMFPNPFAGEIGIATSRGVAVDRAIQAIYQAARIISLVSKRARVLEIGGGLGRTGFYARMFGIMDYTIVDLPLSGVAQGYFLGRTLGPDAIALFGEDRPGVRVLPPTAFLDADDRYDLVLNVDSLTEMSPDTAKTYLKAIKDRSGLFLSINHEANPFTVRDLCTEISLVAETRMPYWMRRGYVEEIYRL